MKTQRVSHLEYLRTGYPAARSLLSRAAAHLRVNAPAQTSVRLLDPGRPGGTHSGGRKGALAGSVFEMGVCGGREVKPRLLRLVMA